MADLAFGILALSLTTSQARRFNPKGSLILEQAATEKGQPEAISDLGVGVSTTTGLRYDIVTQSFGIVEANGKRKAEAGIGPYEHLKWAIEALKAEG